MAELTRKATAHFGGEPEPAEDEQIVLCPDFCSALLDQPAVTVSAVFDCTVFSDVR